MELKQLRVPGRPQGAEVLQRYTEACYTQVHSGTCILRYLYTYVCRMVERMQEACCERDARHTSPAIAQLVDGDASHEQHQRLPLPYGEMALQNEAHQQRYHQNLHVHHVYFMRPTLRYHFKASFFSNSLDALVKLHRSRRFTCDSAQHSTAQHSKAQHSTAQHTCGASPCHTRCETSKECCT